MFESCIVDVIFDCHLAKCVECGDIIILSTTSIPSRVEHNIPIIKRKQCAFNNEFYLSDHPGFNVQNTIGDVPSWAK